MTRARDLFPVLARGGGRWTGDYRFVDPSGVQLDHYRVDTDADFPADGSADYRLRTHNVWPDGRETRAELLADLRDGRLEWRNKLVGSISEIDEFTVYLSFTYASDPTIRVCEMIQVSPDGQHRARTWHWFRDHILYQTTLTREERVA